MIVAAGADTGVDAGQTLKAALEPHGGRGGGKARLAQGTVSQPDSLAAVLASLLEAFAR
ncbi:MAG: hypothetical protein H0T86_11250 [Gemmatimonadales bacterium]|nr:hypothetical protein [Gemmatimonadales bacterium]